MKRKIIQIGQTSKIISLPKPWVDKNELNKGDEVNIKEVNNRLVIENPTFSESFEKEYDIDGYDRTSIQLLIRSAYFSGVNKIVLKYSNREFYHFRQKKNKDIEIIINEELMRISGYTLIEVTDSYAIIESLSHDRAEDFQTFYKNGIQEFISALNYIKVEPLDSINFEAYHNRITLFFNVASRNIIKFHTTEQKYVLYHNIIRELDILLDIYKYFFRYAKLMNKLDSYELKEKLNNVVSYCEEVFNELLGEHLTNASKIYELKEKVKADNIKIEKDPKMSFLSGYLYSILELTLNVILSCVSLNILLSKEED